MTEHRYILEPYKGKKTRYACPACRDKERTFAKYVDTETGEHLDDYTGRCNRVDSCGYHYTPKQFFADHPEGKPAGTPQIARHIAPRVSKPEAKPISFIEPEPFKASLRSYERNAFVQYLIKLFGADVAGGLISQYFIGTSKHWGGANIFWQIDSAGKVRTGKIMLYNPETGKRVKDPFNHINWVHTSIEGFNLMQCFYGEHLLNAEPGKPVAIVESEKTAIIASIYLPRFVWIAAGSLTNISAAKCEVLKGRNVFLYPDLNGYEKWSAKAKELSHITSFIVSDILESKATEAERKAGLDLADYLIRFDYKEFAAPQEPAINEVENDLFDTELTELERYFTTTALPDRVQAPNPFHTIDNLPGYVRKQIAFVKLHKEDILNGDTSFIAHLDSLSTLINLIKSNAI